MAPPPPTHQEHPPNPAASENNTLTRKDTFPKYMFNLVKREKTKEKGWGIWGEVIIKERGGGHRLCDCDGCVKF